jgi:hypothetical protein
MTFKMPTLDQIPQNGTKKLCLSQPFDVTLSEASTALCDGARFQRLMLPKPMMLKMSMA